MVRPRTVDAEMSVQFRLVTLRGLIILEVTAKL